MLDDRGVLRDISWRELFPWLALGRAFRSAVSPAILVLAMLGVLVSSLGWRIGPYIFLTQAGREAAGISPHAWQTGELPAARSSLENQMPHAVRKYLPAEPSGVLDRFLRLSEPVRRLVSYETSVGETAYYLFGFLWSLAVWALVGGFITRHVVVRTAIDDAPGHVETAQFVVRRWHWYCLAPLYPLLGIMVLVVLHVPLGWLMIADFGVLVAGVLWLLVLLAGVAAAWLLLGALLGWPLMWGALGAEREGDAFEAFSRSFSYVYGRPLHYLFYAIVASIFGALGYAAAQVFIYVAYEFGFWAVSWGAGGVRAGAVHDLIGAANQPQPLAAGLWMLWLWKGVAYAFLEGYAYAYFWSAAGIIYLLLRKDVDDKEMDEVYLPEDDLPPHPGTASSAAVSSPSGPSAAAPETDAEA